MQAGTGAFSSQPTLPSSSQLYTNPFYNIPNTQQVPLQVLPFPTASAPATASASIFTPAPAPTFTPAPASTFTPTHAPPPLFLPTSEPQNNSSWEKFEWFSLSCSLWQTVHSLMFY